MAEAPLTLGRRAGVLNLQLETGHAFVDRLQLQAGANDPNGLAEGTPVNWPDGTEAYLRIVNKRSQTVSQWPATVFESYMSWHVAAAQVDLVAQEAWAELVVVYPDDPTPWLFREGPVSWR